MGEKEVKSMIAMVGFASTKAANFKKTTEMLFEKFGGKVPSNKEDLISLPGVGPKMAFLVLQEAFGQQDSGICVDVHVHKICNRLGWVKFLDNKNSSSKKVQDNSDSGNSG